MKRFVVTVLLVLGIVSFNTAHLSAEPPADAGKIRILLTHGGHGFEAEPFYALFDGMEGVEYTKAELPKEADLLKPGLQKQFDCIVMYDMVRGISPEQQNAFEELLATGIGVVSLHHNLGAHRNWDKFRAIIGGKFILEPTEIDGKKYQKTPWSHDEDLKVTVVDRKHPITQGVDNFEIHDETYGTYYTAPGIHLLLTTDHPKNNPEIAWTTCRGKSRVFFFMLGHDGKAYANGNFKKILRQGIGWTAKR